MEIIAWLVFTILCTAIAPSRGRSAGAWFILGLLFSLLALIALLVLPKNNVAIEQESVRAGVMKRCPNCAELVRNEAVTCRFCQHKFEMPAVQERSDCPPFAPTEPRALYEAIGTSTPASEAVTLAGITLGVIVLIIAIVKHFAP